MEVPPRSSAPATSCFVDVEFIEPIGPIGKAKKHSQYTAIDDCTHLRVLRCRRHVKTDPVAAGGF